MTMLLEFRRLCDILENVQLSSDPDVLSWHLTERELLGRICLRGHVPRLFTDQRRYTAVEDGCTAPCPLLLLAGFAG
jgi:hypothetical protein